jgi:hypothetical protein
MAAGVTCSWEVMNKITCKLTEYKSSKMSNLESVLSSSVSRTWVYTSEIPVISLCIKILDI